jgi:hypothetical protein
MAEPVVGIDPTVLPSGPGCTECEGTGGWWFHLRRCAQCGHIGCCDSSPSQHASAHAAATGHPIIRSYEPGEGTVNLLNLSAVWAWLDRAGRSAWPVSGRCGRAGDLVPRGESVGHFASVLLGTEPVAAWPEVWGDAAEGGQEPLGVPG